MSNGKSTTGASPAKPGRTFRTFREMIDKGRFTVRELTGHLRMAPGTINLAKDNPTRLSLGDVARLADLLDEPFEKILEELVHEISLLPQESQPVQPVPVKS